MTDEEIKDAISTILEDCEDWRCADDGGSERYFDTEKALELIFRLIKVIGNDNL